MCVGPAGLEATRKFFQVRMYTFISIFLFIYVCIYVCVLAPRVETTCELFQVRTR